MNSTQQKQFPSLDSDQRPPVLPSDKNSNAVALRKPRTREVSSRYKSSTPFSSSRSPATSTVPSLSSRCPSPKKSRSSSFVDQKRAQSVGNRRPSSPSSSPSRPTTPVQESKLKNGVSDLKRSIGRSPESLWPSTRSLCVSFQADTFTLPVTKRERPVSHFTDHAMSSSVSRHNDSHSVIRKTTPERKGTPLRGKNAYQSENSKPLDNSLARTFDHHRWPSSNLVKGNNALTRSVDLSDSKAASLVIQGWGTRSNAICRGFQQSVNERNLTLACERVARRMSCDGTTAEYDVSRSLNRESSQLDEGRHSDSLSDPASPSCSLLNSSDTSSVVDSVSSGSDLNSDEQFSDSRSYDGGVSTARGLIMSARFWQETRNVIQRERVQRSPTPERRPSFGLMVPSQIARRPKHESSNPPERAVLNARSSRSRSLPSSPDRTTVASSLSRGISPSRIKGSVLPSANAIPSRTSGCSSILSFMTEVKKGKKGLKQTEDAHQLRLLHNRYLQWRFTNGRADAACSIQNVGAEDLLYSVYVATSDLRQCISLKQIKIQQLRQHIKLYLILTEQMPYLDVWAMVEKEHYSSLSGVIEALEAGTGCLPITNGARADIQAMKDAIFSAAEVIKAMGSSISSLLSKVDRMNNMVSELADTTAQARALIDECGDLLSRVAAIQIEQSSYRAHLIQLRKAIIDQEIVPIETMV